jgi:hypothetical protein
MGGERMLAATPMSVPAALCRRKAGASACQCAEENSYYFRFSALSKVMCARQKCLGVGSRRCRLPRSERFGRRTCLVRAAWRSRRIR